MKVYRVYVCVILFLVVSSAGNAAPGEWFYVCQDTQSPLATDDKKQAEEFCPYHVLQKELNAKNLMQALKKTLEIIHLLALETGDQEEKIQNDKSPLDVSPTKIKMDSCRDSVAFIAKSIRRFDPLRNLERKHRYLGYSDDLNKTLSWFVSGVRSNDRDLALTGYIETRRTCKKCHRHFR